MPERFHLRKHKKLILFLSLFLLFDIFFSGWYILGWRPPFYDNYYKSKSIKKGTQWVVYGTVTNVSDNTVSLSNLSNKITPYVLPNEAAYYLSIEKNDKNFSRGIQQVNYTLPKIGDWVGLNLLDEGNKGKFKVQAVFIMIQ